MTSQKSPEITCVTLCSSRGRPRLCERMVKSFYETRSSSTDIFVYVDENDPEVSEYREVLAGVPHEIGPHKFMCHVLNYGALVKYPGLKYYHEANDDHIFRTPQWDLAMETAIEEHGGWGIAYGQTDNLPTSIMVSGNVVDILGYWFYPDFQHHSCDLYVKDLCNEAGLDVYVPDVLIEHMHQVWGKAEIDDNYRWVYSPGQEKIGTMAYMQWCNTRKPRDIQMLKTAMETK